MRGRVRPPAELGGHPAWTTTLLALAWFALLVAFFVWAPWLLTHAALGRSLRA
jgi:hypothetical protein